MKMKAKWASAPYIVWMILFTIIPLAMIVYFAFTSSDGGFTLDNLKNAAIHIPTLMNSIYLAMISTVICLVLAYPIAYYISVSPTAIKK